MTQLRPLVIGSVGTVPRAWPSFRNVILRMFDGDRAQIYDSDNVTCAPEWRAYQQLLDTAAKAVADTQESLPEDRAIRKLAKSEFEKVSVVVEACGFSAPWFEEVRLVKDGAKYLKQQLATLFADAEDEE